MKSGTLEEIQSAKATTPLRALILEHSGHDVELMVFELEQSGFQVKHTLVETREEFHAALAEKDFDAVLAQLPVRRVAYIAGTWSF